MLKNQRFRRLQRRRGVPLLRVRRRRDQVHRDRDTVHQGRVKVPQGRGETHRRQDEVLPLIVMVVNIYRLLSTLPRRPFRASKQRETEHVDRRQMQNHQ